MAPPAGTRIVGDRTDDLCGSLTADNGGFDSSHVEGYECVALRRVLLIAPDSGYDRVLTMAIGANFLQLNGYPPGPAQKTEAGWSVDIGLDHSHVSGVPWTRSVRGLPISTADVKLATYGDFPNRPRPLVARALPRRIRIRGRLAERELH